MNRTNIMLMLVAGLAVFFACKNEDSSTAPTGTGIISGTVADSSSGVPLSGVTVTAQSAASGTQSQVTDATGSFSFEYATDSARTVTLTFAKSGFRSRTVVAEASSGNVTTLSVAMSSSTPISGGTTSGAAASIFLVSALPTDISVYGVGGNETSYLTWEVRDSVGLPIDAAHAVTVAFSINGGLGGGEYVYPVSVQSNAQGRVATSLSSGIVSGVVQVVGTITLPGRSPITSQPIRIVVHSGYADPGHFSLGAARYNFPALGILGELNSVGVLIGDIYSNPIVTNTAVYFASRAGVILSSAFTSASGQANADLISGSPYPIGSNALTPYGNGYHYAIASTLGRNGAVVRDSILLLWTGASQISNISPSSFDIANGGSQQVSFRVSDPYGNTLSAPTTISVSVTGAQAIVGFGNNGSFTISRDVILPPGANTQFSCFVSDNLPDSTFVSSATLSISVTSAGNGNATATIGGTIR